MLLVGDRQGRAWQFAASALGYVLPALFILAPLASFLVYSFFWTEGGQMHYDLTLFNYRRLFTDTIFIPVLWQTCILCLAVAVLTTLFGYPVAFLLANLKGRRKYMLLMMVLVPLLMSYI